MNNSLPTTHIAGMTVAQYRSTLSATISKVCSVSVDISQAKRWLRPTIYSWHIVSNDGRSTCSISTYGEHGDIWALSFDDGASWLTISSFGECIKLCVAHFASWQN